MFWCSLQQKEIRDTAQALRRARLPDTEILPLLRASDSQSRHGYSQPTGAQDCAFYECGETSITVPGINYVIDTGLARTSRYSIRQYKGTDRTHFSGERQSGKGRFAGLLRVSVSDCIQADFESRDEFTDRKLCERIWHRSF